MKKKNIISLMLSVILLISTTTAFAKDYSDYPQKFWDVSKSHWAYNYISELTDKNVISGYDDGSFKPENTVSRAEWSKMMVTASKLEINKTDYYISDLSKDHWAYNYVITAKDYMNWYQNGDSISFRPNQSASREDVTVSLVKLKGYSVSDVDYSSLSAFKDIDSISNDLKKYVAVALDKKLISGFEDNTFRGQDTLTRAEAATLLCRAFQMGDDNKIVDFKDFFKDDNKGISETTKPVELPTPTPYVEPTVTPTKEPVIEPTIKPVAETSKKELTQEQLTYYSNWYYETLVDNVVLPSPDFYTYDEEDNLYYFDSGILRKVNMLTREVSDVCDTNNFNVYSDGNTYKILNLHQIFFNRKDDYVIMYADIKNDSNTIEKVLIKPDGNLLSYNKEKIKDDIGNNYHVNKFIGVTKDGDLLYSAKCNEDSYCHAMLMGPNWQNGVIMDPTYLQPEDTHGWKPFNGFAGTGYNSCNVTTYCDSLYGLRLVSYNRSFQFINNKLSASTGWTAGGEFAGYGIGIDGTMYSLTTEGNLLIKNGRITGHLGIGLFDFEKFTKDNKPVDLTKISPVLVSDSNADIIFYDKLNSCFRIIKRYDVDTRAEHVDNNNLY